MLIFCLYGVSLPIAFILGIKMDYGVSGLWIGFAIGRLIQAMMYAVIMYRADWIAVFQLNYERRIQHENYKLLSEIRSRLGSSHFTNY